MNSLCGSGILLELISLYSSSSGSHLFAPRFPRFDSLVWMHEAACGFSVTKEITLCSTSCSFMGRKLQVLLWSLVITFVKKKKMFPLLMSQPQSWKQWKVGLFPECFSRPDRHHYHHLLVSILLLGTAHSTQRLSLLLRISVSHITCTGTVLDSAMKLF